MSQPLSGKTAVITGAAGAIGVATAQIFARRGASIFALDRAGSDFSHLSDAMPEGAALTIAEGDVTREDDVARAFEHARATLGRIDILFNNAGIKGPVAPIEAYAANAFATVIAVNVMGVFFGLKHGLPIMYEQGAGSIINSSSITGLIGTKGAIGYTASKHAVVGLTRGAAAEAAERGVRVNCINPGPIESPMMAAIDAERGSGSKEEWAAGVPAGRYGTTAEVAAMVAFLASDEAAYCNGGIYIVDGGLSAI